MKATIYFKESLANPYVTVEGLTLIKGRSVGHKSSTYDDNDKIRIFTTFPDESYVFVGNNGTFSIAGNEILYVKFTED